MAEREKDQHQFRPLLIEIEEEPLNPLGRVIFWALLVILVFFSFWMYFGRVDVVITARGKVIPSGEVQTIQPLTTGVVREILVRPGQMVEADQVLMEIDPAETEPELASMKSDLKQVVLEILRIEAQLANHEFEPPANLYDPVQLELQKRSFQSARNKLEQQLQVKREELAQVEQRLATEKKGRDQVAILLESGRRRLARLESVRELVSRDDWDRARTEVLTHEAQLEAAGHKIEELQSSRKQRLGEILLIQEEDRNRLLETLTTRRQERLYLEAKIERTEFITARQQIRSPVRGFVSQLLVHTVGGVVTPAEKLAIIVPSDSPKMIKAQVMNRDVGYLVPGMDVAVKVDTFEFQKYGMLPGKLKQIAQDSIEDDQLGLVYEAYVEPLETALMVEGVEVQLATGMTVAAEIKVGKRRIIEFFIYPLIKYFNEGTSVR